MVSFFLLGMDFLEPINSIHLSEAFLSTCPIWSAWPLRSLCLCELRVSKMDGLGEALAAAGAKVLRDVAANLLEKCLAQLIHPLKWLIREWI